MAALTALMLAGCEPTDPPPQPAETEVAEGEEAAALEEPIETPSLEDWRIRTDDPAASREAITFERTAEGVHVALGPAAIFYDPSMTARGSYRVHGTFTQNEATEHPEAYGLFFGGRDLQGPDQRYSYFLVRQTGEYLIKRRMGGETSVVVDWTADPAVRAIGDSGAVTNELAIEVGADSVRFVVNDETVETLARTRLDTEGIAGLRINHRLDITVSDFRVEPAAEAAGGE